MNSARLAALILLVPGVGLAADPPPVELTPVGKAILEHTNAERKKADASPLTPEARLTKAAQQFAEYMAREDKFDHEADGRKPWERAEAAGYQWAWCSENIVWKTAPADADRAEIGKSFVAVWMDSPGHKKNLLDPAVTEIGIGAARRGEKVYAVQLFGTPKGAEWKFRVTNDTDTDLSYTLGGQRFDLKPRVTMIHPSVRPIEFAFTPPGGTEAVKRTAKEATTLTIRKSDGKYRVE